MDKKYLTRFDKLSRPSRPRYQVSIRLDAELTDMIELALEAHARERGSPVTMNRLLVHYIVEGLRRDQLLKKI